MIALDKNNAIYPHNILIPNKNDHDKITTLNQKIKTQEQDYKKVIHKNNVPYEKWLEELQNTAAITALPIGKTDAHAPLNNKAKSLRNNKFTICGTSPLSHLKLIKKLKVASMKSH